MPFLLYNSDYVRMISHWGTDQLKEKKELENEFLNTNGKVIFSNSILYRNECDLMYSLYKNRHEENFGGFSTHQGGVKTQSGWIPCMLMSAFHASDDAPFITKNKDIVVGLCGTGFFDYLYPDGYSLDNDFKECKHIMVSVEDIDCVLDARAKIIKPSEVPPLDELINSELYNAILLEAKEFNIEFGNFGGLNLEEVLQVKRQLNLERLLEYVPEESKEVVRKTYPEGVSSAFSLIRSALEKGRVENISFEMLNNIVHASKK